MARTSGPFASTKICGRLPREFDWLRSWGLTSDLISDELLISSVDFVASDELSMPRGVLLFGVR